MCSVHTVYYTYIYVLFIYLLLYLPLLTHLYTCIHSLHELTACIYYKLAIDRGLRGCDPDGEHILHLEHAKTIVQHVKPSTSHTPLYQQPQHQQQHQQSYTNKSTNTNTTPTQQQQQPYNSSSYTSNITTPTRSTDNTPHQTPSQQQHQQSYTTSNSTNTNTTAHTSTTGPQQQQQQSENGFERSLALLNDLNEAIRLAPLALQAVYEESPLECQRLATSQGWCTILCCTESNPEQPAYSLFATDHSSHTDTDNKQTHTTTSTDNTHHTRGHLHAAHTTNTPQQSNSNSNTNSSSGSSGRKKEAVLAIRGTSSVQDIVTDIRSAPHKFPPR